MSSRGMSSPVVHRLEHARLEVGPREVGHWVAARLVEQHDVLAVGDPAAAEVHAHAPAQRFGEQQAFGQWVGHQEAAGASRGQWPSLPGQSHERSSMPCRRRRERRRLR
jgi:hypothetical protein